MITRIGRSGGVALAALIVIAASGADESEFTSREGNFRVELPARPKLTKQKMQSPAGSVTTHLFVARTKAQVTYSVLYADQPPALIKPEAVDGMLDRAVEGLLESSKARATDRRAIELNRQPGREVRFEFDPPRGQREKGVGGVRAYLVGRRIYQVWALGPASKLPAETLTAYLDSFALIEPPSAAAASAGAPAAPSAAPAPAAQPPLVTRDGWGTPLDPDHDCTIRTDRSSAMFVVPGKLHDLATVKGAHNAPRLLHDVKGDFVAEVRTEADMNPGRNGTAPGGLSYIGSGLVFYQDDEHFIRLERAAAFKDLNSVPFLFYVRSDEGKEISQGGNLLSAVGQVSFRLSRRGDQVLAAYSDNGGRWTDLRPFDVSGWPAGGKVGLLVVNTSSKPFKTRFDQFKVQSADAAK
jgi:regulation of enolase protein 1 (concanavalin A-like superfamily)